MPANILRLILCLVPLVLGACSNGELPKWLTGEPTAAEIAAAQGPVAMPPVPPRDTPYPNLADVPQRPVATLDTKGREAERQSLHQENTTGQSLVNAYVKDHPQ